MTKKLTARERRWRRFAQQWNKLVIKRTRPGYRILSHSEAAGILNSHGIMFVPWRD